MAKVIAVDLGGTNLRVSLVKNNKIVKYVKKRTPATQDELLKVLCDTISDLMAKDVKGIGIGSPGPLKDGVILNPPNLPFKNFDLKNYLHKKFKKKVVVDNDADCVALAELKLGVRKRNFLVITLGTGIGGGIIINGKIYTGRGNAAEVGHIILDHDNYFEDLAAWKRIHKMTTENFGEGLLVKDLLKMKNEKSEEILQILCKYMGQGIASLIAVLDPEVVVISGGMKETGLIMMNRIREQVKKYSIIQDIPPIQWTKLAHPGTLGAALLIK